MAKQTDEHLKCVACGVDVPEGTEGGINLDHDGDEAFYDGLICVGCWGAPDPVERALSLLVQSARVSPPLRDAVAVVEQEIRDLREVLVFADGGWVNQTGRALADVYQPEAPALAVIARAGCWRRGALVRVEDTP